MTPLAHKVLSFIETHGSISSQDAFLHMQEMPSGSLTRRITEIKDAGYPIVAETRANPITRKRYTRYSLAHGVTYAAA